MQRVSFKMKLKEGFAHEYKKRHDKIWPELRTALKEAGIYDYAIFLDPESLDLFATYKLTEMNKIGELPSLPIMKKWWDYMADIMETNADNAPKSISLQEVFYLE